MTEKPELFGRTQIVVGLAKDIAIYEPIISFVIMSWAPQAASQP